MGYDKLAILVIYRKLGSCIRNLNIRMSSNLIKTYSYNRDFYRKIIIQQIKNRPV